MLVGFLDKISGYFDRRFMVAFWAPFFLFSAGGVGILVLLNGGMAEMVAEWEAQNASMQALVAFGYLLLVSAGAYLLQAFAPSVLRLFGGGSREKGRKRTTRLGNGLAVAGDHATKLYGLNSELWWPRLVPLLPEAMRTQVDSTLTPLLALLNLSALLSALAVAALASGIAALNIVVFLGGGLLFLLAWISYEAAVLQASDYGRQLRVAFDLYRMEILRQMRLPIPSGPREEKAMWCCLNGWIHQCEPPSKEGWPCEAHFSEGEFQYTHPSKSRKTEVRRRILGK